MTKITVFGQEGKKAIEFVFIMSNRGTVEAALNPSEYDNICLIGHDGEHDQILAWDDKGENKVMYLGHWNDGVVG